MTNKKYSNKIFDAELKIQDDLSNLKKNLGLQSFDNNGANEKINQAAQADNHFNLGFISLLIFFISFFLPFYNLGSNGVTQWDILTVTSNFHVDAIGIFVLFAGGIMLIYNVDMNVIKIATIIGICFPLNRLFRIATIDVDIPTSFAPSFGIGGYLILIGAGIQLYACFSSTIEDNTNKRNITHLNKSKED